MNEEVKVFKCQRRSDQQNFAIKYLKRDIEDYEDEKAQVREECCLHKTV